MDRLEEANLAADDVLDDDDDVGMDNDDNATNEGMKKLDKLYKRRHNVRNWLSLDLTPLGMTLSSSRSSCLKNCANMVSNQPSLSRNPESIPVSRLIT